MFRDAIALEEMQRWVADSEKALASSAGKRGVLVNTRTMKPLKPEVQAVMVEGQKQYKVKGMERFAVALPKPVVAMQFKRTARGSSPPFDATSGDAADLRRFEAAAGVQ